MEFPDIKIHIPEWLNKLEQEDVLLVDHKSRMKFVVELALLNIHHGTGGPFGAAIFEYDTGKLISAGVNLVTSSNLSITHAEIVAISLAQSMTGNYDLSQAFENGCELVTSTEPCAMCMGAIPWAGIKRLVCGATDLDARNEGFDEGAKPANWKLEYEKRGIEVVCEVLREDASLALRKYRQSGGVIYNPGR